MHPQRQMNCPWRTTRFSPVTWPAQAVSYEHGRVVLHLDLPATSGACSLVWDHGFELHICTDIPQAEEAPGKGQAMIVTGRGIRWLNHQRSTHLGAIATKQSRCSTYARRWTKVQRATTRQCRRAERRLRDRREKATRKVIDFCGAHNVGTLFIDHPYGVRTQNHGLVGLWQGYRRPGPHHELHRLPTRSIEPLWAHTHAQGRTLGVSRLPVLRAPGPGWLGHYDVEFPRSFISLRPGMSRSRRSRAGSPNVVSARRWLNHVSRIRSLRRQATPASLLRSSSPLRGRECHFRPVE